MSVVKRKFWKEKVDVLSVCGGDLFIKIQCTWASLDKKYTGCYSDATMAIKMAKENGESIKDLIYDSVADYLHDVVHWI